MKIRRVSRSRNSLTLIEVLVILAIVIILAVVLWLSTTFRRQPPSIVCVNNLRQIGAAFTMYVDDHNGKFPFQIGATNDTATKLIQGNHVFPYYQKVSNALINGKVLICSFDTTRHAAADFEALNDSNVSYFLNVDAREDSSNASILAGDRFLEQDRASGKVRYVFPQDQFEHELDA